MNTKANSETDAPPLWIALFQVKALPTNTEHPDLEAFVSGITPAEKIDHALEKFRQGLKDWRFALVKTKEIEEFELRSKRSMVDPDMKAMAHAARDLNGPVFGYFFGWSEE